MPVNLKGLKPSDAAALKIPFQIQHTNGVNVDWKVVYDFIPGLETLFSLAKLKLWFPPYTLTIFDNENSYNFCSYLNYPTWEVQFLPNSNGSYRIYNKFSDKYLCNGDSFFLKFAHKAELSGVEFQIDDAEMSDSTPIVLMTKYMRNATAIEQNMSFSYKEVVRDTSAFTNNIGLELEVGTEFKVGIPFVTEGKVHMNVGTNYSRIWGKEHTIEKTHSSKHNLIGEPGKLTTAKIIIQRANFKVPYKMTFETESGQKFHSHGVWEGVSHWNIRSDIDCIPIA